MFRRRDSMRWLRPDVDTLEKWERLQRDWT
jgi:hypothetical protein